MGRPKANLPLGDQDTFLSRIVRTFHSADVEDVVVVVGYEPVAILEAFSRTGEMARFVENPDFDRGQLSSLVRGLNAVDRPGVVGALVTLVDVPFFGTETVRAVVGRYRESRAPVVRPVRGAAHGHPVLIDRSLFDAIRQADPVAGAKVIVRAHASSAGDVEVDDEGAFVDIDTASDYEQFLARVARQGFFMGS